MSLTRMTVNLTPRAVSAIEAAMAKTGDSKTDVVNHSVLVYNMLLDTMEDGSFTVVRRDGSRETVTIL